MFEDVFHWRGREIYWGREGSGPPVVFCHGTPFSSVLWRPFVEALRDEYTLYWWDMGGYGRSSKLEDHTVDFGVQSELLTALFSHWELNSAPHVVAHDFGGAVSLRAHLIHGVPFASLMLIDVVAIPPSGSPFFRYVQRNHDEVVKLPAYIHEAIVCRYIANASQRPLSQESLAELASPWLGADGQAAFYRQISQYDEKFLSENEENLSRLDIPVRIVWGECDAWVPVEMATKLQTLIPGATLRTIPRAGHLVHEDAPASLATHVYGWLVAQA